MLQTVACSACVTIDVEDVVGGLGINEERAGTNTKEFSKYQSKQFIRLLCSCKQSSGLFGRLPSKLNTATTYRSSDQPFRYRLNSLRGILRSVVAGKIRSKLRRHTSFQADGCHHPQKCRAKAFFHGLITVKNLQKYITKYSAANINPMTWSIELTDKGASRKFFRGSQ